MDFDEASEGMDFFQEQPMDSVTLEDFENLTDKFFELREEKEQMRKVMSEKESEIKAIEKQLIAFMEQYEKTNHSGRKGSISVAVSRYPSMPKDPDKKRSFFSYLQEQGVYEDLVSVNHNTLQSWYKQEVAANEDDPLFEVPGLEPYERKTLRARKAR